MSDFTPVTVVSKDGKTERTANTPAALVRFKFDGWTEKGAAAVAKAPFGADSDPKDYTVDEVNAYLIDADETETDRVLTAERTGKARTGIVG